jgi:hypothetical protein
LFRYEKSGLTDTRVPVMSLVSNKLHSFIIENKKKNKITLEKIIVAIRACVLWLYLVVGDNGRRRKLYEPRQPIVQGR